mgnify:FL=1
MLQTVVLALVQSAAEFLPVSSSAHLILVPLLFGWRDQGLAADIALHVGTLFSVMIYFRADVAAMLSGGIDILKRRFATPAAALTMRLGVGCLPVFIIGALSSSYIAEHFRNPLIVATTAVVGGVLLYAADRIGGTDKNVAAMTLKDAFLIGCAQVLALIPGISRSGITMTAARALGIERGESARFSMLLSVPTIGAAGMLGIASILANGETGGALSGTMILTGGLISFAGGVLAIGFLMRWLKTSSFAVFAIYRVLLGIYLFYVF